MTQKAIFDPALVLANQKRANAMSEGAFLRPKVRESLCERLEWVNRTFNRALEINAPDNQLVDQLKRSGKIKQGEVLKYYEALSQGRYEALFALSGLETINQLPHYLVCLKQALVPDGLLIAAMLGGDTLSELRQACLHADLHFYNAAHLRVHPCLYWQDAGTLLQSAGLALPVVDRETYSIAYHSLGRLVHDLRAMGLGNALVERSKIPLTREYVAFLEAWLSEHYPNKTGGFVVTFDMLWLMGWSPHPDQPQAMKPGTARLSLASVLSKSEQDGKGLSQKGIKLDKPSGD